VVSFTPLPIYLQRKSPWYPLGASKNIKLIITQFSDPVVFTISAGTGSYNVKWIVQFKVYILKASHQRRCFMKNIQVPYKQSYTEFHVSASSGLYVSPSNRKSNDWMNEWIFKHFGYFVFSTKITWNRVTYISNINHRAKISDYTTSDFRMTAMLIML